MICVWKHSKNDKSKDIKGKSFSFPKNGNIWTGQKQFIKRLNNVQKYLQKKNPIDKKCVDCLLCKKKCIKSMRYNLGNYIWDGNLIHYIEFHNIKPSEDFMEKIWIYNISEKNKSVYLFGRFKSTNDQQFLKLGRNQIMILDALMKHGGYSKKYYDSKNTSIVRYSEHAGYLEIKGREIRNIIVSGNTMRVDRGDEEIFLPIGTEEAYLYKYIYHTHPPSPKPGGRAKDGILYEFPSVGDILHFIDHHNDGETRGSLVMTSEGLYNIRKLNNKTKKINIDEDSLYNEMRKEHGKIQNAALKKYGDDFNTYKFYSIISQDLTFIDMFNNKLNKYDLTIDFYPRNKDFKGSWIVDTIYIPLE